MFHASLVERKVTDTRVKCGLRGYLKGARTQTIIQDTPRWCILHHRGACSACDACPRCMSKMHACPRCMCTCICLCQHACPRCMSTLWLTKPIRDISCIGVRRGSSGQGCFRSSIDGQGLSSHLSSSAFICLLICLLICLHLSSSLCLCVSFNIWMREGMGA